MLVPLEKVVGTGYNAGLTATAFAQQPDHSAGGGYTSPSGLPIGGLRVGYDEDYHRTSVDAQSRYSAGPPAVQASSELGYLPKDRSVPYLTQQEYGMRGLVGLGDVPGGTSFLQSVPWWVYVIVGYKVLLG